MLSTGMLQVLRDKNMGGMECMKNIYQDKGQDIQIFNPYSVAIFCPEDVFFVCYIYSSAFQITVAR